MKELLIIPNHLCSLSLLFYDDYEDFSRYIIIQDLYPINYFKHPFYLHKQNKIYFVVFVSFFMTFIISDIKSYLSTFFNSYLSFLCLCLIFTDNLDISFNAYVKVFKRIVYKWYDYTVSKLAFSCFCWNFYCSLYNK